MKPQCSLTQCFRGKSRLFRARSENPPAQAVVQSSWLKNTFSVLVVIIHKHNRRPAASLEIAAFLGIEKGYKKTTIKHSSMGICQDWRIWIVFSCVLFANVWEIRFPVQQYACDCTQCIVNNTKAS